MGDHIIKHNKAYPQVTAVPFPAQCFTLKRLHDVNYQPTEGRLCLTKQGGLVQSVHAQPV